MLITTGNIWESQAGAIVVTTNGVVKKNGEAVMGKGIAKEAAERHPWLPRRLGDKITAYGNQVYVFYNGPTIITYPTKHHWREKSDLSLIETGAKQLRDMAEIFRLFRVAMPAPGCGNGQLTWEEVRPVIEPYLDDRFKVYLWNSS